MFSGFLEIVSSALFQLKMKMQKGLLCCKTPLLECICTISVLAPSNLVSFPSEFIYTFYRSVYFNRFFSPGMRGGVFLKSFGFFLSVYRSGKEPREIIWKIKLFHLGRE